MGVMWEICLQAIMKDLIKNRLEVKAEMSGAQYILESLPMLIEKFNVDEFNIKHMGATDATFTFKTNDEPPRDMIRTISRGHKKLLFLLEHEGHGKTKRMYLVKNDEVLIDE